MLPSASRVKLNRVALKDVVGANVEPRRRRPAKKPQEPKPASASGGDVPVQTSLTGPENVTANPAGGEQAESRVDINRSAQRSPTGHGGAQVSLRRSVGAPHQMILGTQRQKGPPVFKVKSKREIRVTEAEEKNISWIDQYPKVTLCDVAKKCDSSSPNYGYVLPDVLKNKVVRCFKEAGVRFWPCYVHDHHRIEKSSPAPNNKFSPRVQSEKSVSQSLTEPQCHPEEQACAQTLFGSWTSESSATCSASFSPGGGRMMWVECRTGMWDKDVEEDPRMGCRQIGTEVHRDKRMKLEDIKDGVLPAALSLESNGCRDAAAETAAACGEKLVNSGSRSEHAGAASSSTLNVNSFHEKPGGEIEMATDADAPQMTSEALFQGNETELDEPESFTCQRVRPYVKKIKFSCARTCMPWPFSNSGPTIKVHAAFAGGPAEAVDPIAGLNCGSPPNQNQPGSPSDENGESVQDDTPTSTVELATHYAAASLAGLGSPALARIANPSPGAGERDAASSPAVDETESQESTPFLSALGLSDCETATTLSPMSSPSTHEGSSSLSATPSSLPPSSAQVKGAALTSFSPDCVVEALEETLFFEVTQMTPWTPSSAQPCDSDSFHSCESSLFLPPHEQGRSDRFSPARSPLSDTWPFNHTLAKDELLHTSLKENYLNEFLLPPMLSPVTSPQRPSGTSPYLQEPGCSHEEEEEAEQFSEFRKPQMSSRCHMTPIVDGKKDYPEHGCEEKEVSETTIFNQSSADRGGGGNDDDDNDDGEQNNKNSSDPKMQTALVSGEPTEPRSYPSSDNDVVEACCETHSSPDEGSGQSDADESGAEVANHLQHGALDEIAAYEQDILLVDVNQDDPELFENLPEQSLLKLGPIRAHVAPVARMGAASLVKPRLTPANKTGPLVRFDVAEKTNFRSWRPQGGGSTASKTSLPDTNNNQVNGVPERSPSLWNADLLHNNLAAPMTAKNSPSIPKPKQFRQQNSIGYCRQYFSDSLSCSFKMCRFQHVPAEGDEKLCIETLTRFLPNPMCLQKAGAMFVCYYQSNRPGACFSMPVLLNLLWALLKAGMVSDVLSVLSVSLTHEIVPSHEFLLALFNHVRENDLLGVVPELMRLTFKMASAGLVLSLDCLDCVKNTEFQQAVNANSLVLPSGNKSSTGAPLPEYLNLAHSIVEIELCSKQEDWGGMGKVFSSIVQSSEYANQVVRISGRIAIALLAEGKDKLSLPFAAFAETVCQSERIDSPIKSSLGRIGVSLMLRYHKTHQWAKGRRVVEVLSVSKVNYATLKGLFGNEDGASRCHLVTVATELFLLSGSLEGALNTLRENKWFLSSCVWPCEPADLESRTRVLMRLAEKTSHRDTLEVLCNLPGLKEPNDLVDTSRYASLFNSQLRVCVDRQIYPVASDAVDFMLSKNLPVDPAMLQLLLNKLGKQNLWIRAREVFRHSLSRGYYPGVSSPPGFMALIVPCRLGEVELALSLEMFITVNGTDIFRLSETSTSCLSVTLKRTQSCESEYLAAGSRILSAACVLHPKVLVHYTSVNASQDQVFLLDVPSARCWLRQNHMWANEVWTH